MPGGHQCQDHIEHRGGVGPERKNLSHRGKQRLNHPLLRPDERLNCAQATFGTSGHFIETGPAFQPLGYLSSTGEAVKPFLSLIEP